jgi:hypothetical protein
MKQPKKNTIRRSSLRRIAGVYKKTAGRLVGDLLIQAFGDAFGLERTPIICTASMRNHSHEFTAYEYIYEYANPTSPSGKHLPNLVSVVFVKRPLHFVQGCF